MFHYIHGHYRAIEPKYPSDPRVKRTGVSLEVLLPPIQECPDRTIVVTMAFEGPTITATAYPLAHKDRFVQVELCGDDEFVGW